MCINQINGSLNLKLAPIKYGLTLHKWLENIRSIHVVLHSYTYCLHMPLKLPSDNFTLDVQTR